MSNVMEHEEAIAWLNTDDYDSTGYHVAVEHAIGVLNKRVLMKPVIKTVDSYIEDVCCPVCMHAIGYVQNDMHRARDSWACFCWSCGQKVGEIFEDNE